MSDSQQGRDRLQRFYYQPAWTAMAIFWGGWLATLGLSIILQMEFGAYESVYWPAMALLVATILVGIGQVLSRRLTLDQDTLCIHQLLAGNSLKIPLTTIKMITVAKHSLSLETTTYGKIKLVRLANMQKLRSAFEAVNCPVVDGTSGTKA